MRSFTVSHWTWSQAVRTRGFACRRNRSSTPRSPRTRYFWKICEKERAGNQVRQSQKHEIVNGSKPYRPAGIGRTTRGAHSRCAVRCSLSPHPSPLPWGAWGEGAPFSPRRTIQSSQLSAARCALFPLPGGEDQGEGKRRELPTRLLGQFPEPSNWTGLPAEPGLC